MVHDKHKIADAHATLYAEKLYSCFEVVEAEAVRTSEEDYAAGFEDGVRYKEAVLVAVKAKVTELLTVADAFDEKCSLRIAEELEALCKKI